MNGVLETLMDACGSLGKRPLSPFRDVSDFEAQVLDWFPAAGDREKTEQLTWVLMAVREAEVGDSAASSRASSGSRGFRSGA